MEKNRFITVMPYQSPCGTLLLGSIDDRLCLCDWQVEKPHDKVMPRLRRILGAELTEGNSAVLSETASQLDLYFAGSLTEFSIPLLTVGSDFQKRVWNELMKVPYGTTLSYSELSRRLGSPSAVRAVANANGANALSIVIPCHRIIGANRTLTGYGGGLPIKKFLLDLEKAPYLH